MICITGNDCGYTVILDSASDLEIAKTFVDYTIRPCEWAERLGTSEYISAVFVKDNSTAVTLIMPLAIAPAHLLCELDT